MPRQEIATGTIPFNKIEMKMTISIRIVIMCKNSKIPEWTSNNDIER
jgi:hypothetical protein